MRDIVVFISPDFESAQKQKIAEMLRIQQIQTTDDMQKASVILQPKDAVNTEAALRQEIANHQHIFKMMPNIMIPKSVFKTRKKTYNKNQTKIQFNKIQQRQKQFLINRTRHK